MNRSQLVHIARAQVANRFQLIHLTAAITRAFHKPGKQCIGKTINEALERIAAKGEGEQTFNFPTDEREEAVVAGHGSLHSQVLTADM